MTDYYEQELGRLRETYSAALTEDVSKLKVAFSGASESSVIAVGSGGSFTVASLICGFHETYTGRVSRPSTPLEIICNPNLAAASPVFLVSAEGKNPDVIEALDRARHHSARQIHIITNRDESRLVSHSSKLTDISVHSFPIDKKDGYLATNSLLLDAVVVGRAYAELDENQTCFPESLDDLKLQNGSLKDWNELAVEFATLIAGRAGLIILHSPFMRPVAADLESKLSESALLYSQVVDFRSFAHGRHLWVAQRPDDCAIVAMVDPSVQHLWEETRRLLPTATPILTIEVDSSAPASLLTGLIAEMHLVSSIARTLGRDAGHVAVPAFGRELHYLNYSELIKAPREEASAQRSKYEVLGAKWPSPRFIGKIERAFEEFSTILQQQTFRSIVFDYDGTLCRSQRFEAAPSAEILQHIERLIRGGVVIGIASGRGGSVHDILRDKLDPVLWPMVHLGLYNGGWLATLDESSPDSEDRPTSEFISQVTRIIGRLQESGVPIETIKTTHPYQVSVRFREGARPETMWFVIADSLRQAGLELTRVVHSKHSIDVLEGTVSKSHLIARMIQSLKIDPYDILTMGDQGAWPGNDASLLEHRFSVSVDTPSRRLDRGWKFAPSHRRDVDAAIWYLDRMSLIEDGRFSLNLE